MNFWHVDTVLKINPDESSYCFFNFESHIHAEFAYRRLDILKVKDN